jgi:L-threonine kinase
VAACRAVANALGDSLTVKDISRLAVSMEPSDGLMYPGVVCYNHRRGELIELLGPLPSMQILVVDLGGHIDTLAYNELPKDYCKDELKELSQAFDLVRAGVKKDNRKLVGKGATISAQVNQRLLPKAYLDTLVEIAQLHHAYGVCVAHSGTVAGLLFDDGTNQEQTEAEDSIKKKIDASLLVYPVRSL